MAETSHIQILSGSFEEHRTLEGITVTTRLMMLWADYYRGWGTLYDEEDKEVRPMYLPWEGDNFAIYHQTGGYLSDCYLVDITTQSTGAKRTTWDVTGSDLDSLVEVTYTWSNTGLGDTIRPGEASTWKITFDTEVETRNEAQYYDTDAGHRYEWKHKFFSTHSDFASEYNALTADEQEEYRMNHDAPELEIRVPRTTCTLRAYSYHLYTYLISQNLGKINSVDFLTPIYTRREAALAAKLKKAGYVSNDFLGQDDTGKWLFLDWNLNEHGNSIFEYNFIFEYNRDGWQTSYGIATNMYNSFDFATLYSHMMTVSPNSRIVR